MSDIEINEDEFDDFEDQIDPDIYLNDEELDNKMSNPNTKYLPNKNKADLDNDDNVNDYLDDEDPEDPEDVDINDENYDDYDLDGDYNEENEDLNQKNKVNFIDNELENDSKIQFITKNDDKITSNILTIYEITELIGIRATQISNGAPVFTDIEYLNDPIEMAKKEIINNKCPLYVKRYIGLDKYELWDPNTMIKPKL